MRPAGPGGGRSHGSIAPSTRAPEKSRVAGLLSILAASLCLCGIVYIGYERDTAEGGGTDIGCCHVRRRCVGLVAGPVEQFFPHSGALRFFGHNSLVRPAIRARCGDRRINRRCHGVCAFAVSAGRKPSSNGPSLAVEPGVDAAGRGEPFVSAPSQRRRPASWGSRRPKVASITLRIRKRHELFTAS